MTIEKETKSKSHNDRLRIKVSNNGPYLVSGRIPIAEQMIITDTEGCSHGWRVGKEYPLVVNQRNGTLFEPNTLA